MGKSTKSKTQAQPLPQALSLSGRRIVVTGAASGIGRATAKAVAELGADVMLVDLASLGEVKAEIEAMGVKADVLQGDMTAPDFTAKLLAKGPYGGLAHCAGILYRPPLAKADDPVKRFHQLIDINLRVPIEIGEAFVEHLAGQGGGGIVFIGSVAGRTGGTSLGTPIDYAASKGGVHTLVRWLSRRAVGKRVLVNGVAPGPIETPMTASNYIDPTTLPSGRMGKPEEIGWMIAMLLTPAAGYVSGAVLDINGGSYVG